MLIGFWERVGVGAWAGVVVWAGVLGAAQGQVRRAAIPRVAPVKAGAVAAAVPAGASDALLEMAGAASVIFTGRVETVTRNDAAGFVDVGFRIETAVRGCPQAGVYVLREWAGLWAGGVERYLVGQRLLMLLPARGPSGMSAPVGGMDGAIPIVGTGAEPLLDKTGAVAADDGSGGGSGGVDLRWVAARAVRGAVASGGSSGPLRAISGGAVGRPVLPSSGGGDAAGEGWSGPVAPLSPGGGSAAATAAALRPSVEAVMALLRGSGGVSSAAR